MKKSLLGLGVALALVAALLLVREFGASSATRSRYVFDTARASSVTRLHVSLQGDSVTLARTGAGWVVLPDSFPADTARVALALARLLRLEDRETVSKSGDERRLAEYGLSAGEVKVVTWTYANGERDLAHLGHTSGLDFNSTYWKRHDAADVHRTPGNFTHEIGARPADWKDMKLFPAFGAGDVRTLLVRWDDDAGRSVFYTIALGADSAYRLTTPGTAGAVLVPKSTASQLFARAAELPIDEAASFDDPDRGLASLDSPSVLIKVTLRNGAEHSLVTGGESGPYLYFHHPVHRGVVKILTARLAPFRKTPAQLTQAAGGASYEDAGWETVTEPGASR